MDKCEFCHGEIDSDVKKCRHCGEWLNTKEKRRLYIILAIIAFAAVFYDTYTNETALETRQSLSSIDELKIRISSENISEYLLTTHKEMRQNDELYIIGTVSNISNHQIEGAVISVSYYNENDQLIDQSRNYLGDINKVDGKDYKVSFKCCSEKTKSDFSDYKKYKLIVEDAYFYSSR